MGLQKILQDIARHKWDYLFVLPKFAVFVAFIGVPVAWSVFISFQEFGVFQTRWVGLDNFRVAFEDDLFLIALKNTVWYALIVMPANVLIALVLASLIFPLSRKAQTFFRAAFYLPTVTSAVVIAMAWKYIYQPDVGLLNAFLRMLGASGRNWLGQSSTAMWSVIMMSILTPPGVGIIMYLAAMGSIPNEIYEAATVDGASGFQKWWRITVPLLKPTTLYLVVLGTIGSFQVFSQIMIMTRGGPGHATKVLVYLIYETAFRDMEFGLAGAYSLMLFAIIMVFAFIQFKYLNVNLEYY